MENAYGSDMKIAIGVPSEFLDFKKTPYEAMLNPYQRLMVYCGLMSHCVPSKDTGTSGGWRFSRISHTLVLMIAWFNVIRYFGAYHFGEPFDIPMLYKLIIHIAFLWSGCSVLAGHTLGAVQVEMFQHWTQYQRDYLVSYSPKEKQHQRRRVLLALTVTSSVTLLAGVGYCTILVDREVRNYVQVFLLPFYNRCWTGAPDYFIVGMAFLIQVLMMGSSLIVLGYLLLLVLGLRDEFTKFNSEMAGCLVTSPGGSVTFRGDLEHWRRRHSAILGLVRQLDDGLGLYVLVIFTSNIPICCFLLFIVIMGQYALHMRLMVWAMIVPIILLCGSILFTITYCGTKLQSQSVACKSYLYSLYLDGPDWTHNRRLQYKMFYQRLTDGHIGITGWKLFYINKETVKMVVLLVAGYSLILLKNGSPSDAPLFVCHHHGDALGNITSSA